MKKRVKMKFRGVSMLFLMSVLTLTLSAQGDVYGEQYEGNDRLLIERENGQKLTLFWDRREKLNESLEWTELINGFQSNFNKVYENIPEFDFYSILYVQNKKLVVDEVKGKETYTLTGDDEIKYTKSNLCKLVGDNIIIFIEFNEKSELMDSTLISEIKNAADKIKYKVYFSKMSRDQHYFDVSKGEMIQGPRSKSMFGISIGESVGVVKDKLYMETRVGAGVLFGGNKFVSVSGDFMRSYNKLSNSTESDIYVGLNFSAITKGINGGLEFAYKVSDGIQDFEDLNYRLRLTFRLKSIFLFGFENYTGRNGQSYYGVRAGIGIDGFFLRS